MTRVQEERRLCYVGSYPCYGPSFISLGPPAAMFTAILSGGAPSRFLSEIPKDMIQFTGKAAGIVATQNGLYEVANAKKKEFDELKDPEWDDEPV